MGYLTTITFRNDYGDTLRANAEKVVEEIYRAMMRHEPSDISIANCGNPMEAQGTRHADDHTIYVHMGNCVTEMNPYSKETKKIIKQNPDFAKRLIAFMAEETKELKKLLKESQETK